jgi:uncharacterized protein YodC (DUF2158 family)
MQQNDIRPGMVVQLASGGPLMTVVKLLDGDNVHCTWFDNGKVQNNSFPAAALQPDE